MKKLLFVFLFFVYSCNALEKEDPRIDLTLFEAMPIIDQGRVMPIDTYARKSLLLLSGKSSMKNKSAVKWIADLLLTYDNSINDKIFLIENPAVLQAVGMDVSGRNRYSILQLEPYLGAINKLSNSKASDALTAQVQKLDKKVKYYLGVKLFFYKNYPLPKSWGNIIKYYKEGSQFGFDNTIKNMSSIQFEKTEEWSNMRIKTELFFNKTEPFFFSKIFYALALLFILFEGVFCKKSHNKMSLFIFVLNIFAILLVSYGIISRSVILSRPPVTNLYSTFLFVAWASSVIGLIIYKKDKRIGGISSSIAGLVFLLIAGRYSYNDLEVMQAVLDSNFWLAAHVITIMLGYTGCCLAGLISHIYFIQTIYQKDRLEVKKTYDTMLSVLYFGLALTTIGTILGGIWAENSWGRFWGWDPKENGALFIILWVAIILHCKKAKVLGEFGVGIASILGIQAVMLAWFGVNILGIGLHSYGQDGIASLFYLVSFLVLEIFFILFVVIKLAIKNS